MIHYFGNYKQLLMSLFVFFVSLSTVLAQQPISLEDIWRDRVFVPRTIRLGKSMNDGEHFTRLEGRSRINMYSYATGSFVRTLFDASQWPGEKALEKFGLDDYFFSSDEQKLLLAFNTRSIFRYSSESDFYVYDLAENVLYPLSQEGMQRLPQFSPDGSQVAFVRDNNIFLRDLGSAQETAITTDGLHNFIINGTTDWVYEEEFGFTQGFEWSPDGSSIAYYRFDESHVKEFNMLLYGELYPIEHRFKYPKAGEENAHVSIHVYHLSDGNTIAMDTGQNTDQYIPRIKWSRDPHKLAILRLNRHQNHLEILWADVRTGRTELLWEEQNKYYIEITDDLLFLDDGKTFIISSERDGFNHLYQFDLQGRLVRQLTNGPWDVRDFLGVDPKNKKLYYTSAEDSPMENHLYSIGLNGRNKQKLTQAPGYHSPAFSSGFKFFLNNYSTINQPPVFSVHDNRGREIRVLENNEALKQRLAEKGYVPAQFITIPVDEGEPLNAWIIFPPDFDENQKYPVLMYVYGGPNSQTVTDRWNTFNGAWFRMLAQQGYIVVSVDNRGTGARGEAFRKSTYMQLGKLEAWDQIAAAQYLATYPYVDKNSIAIFGWSYGGYLAALCLALGAEVFHAAIAVAPVTSWRFYDTIYTERYMRTPQENPAGYDDYSPLTHASKIKGSLLLVHGSADDNVHYQNTLEMIDALVEADADFELLIYTNYDHGIAGGNARLHLYRQMTRFLERNRSN